jgi:hypothetical protein
MRITLGGQSRELKYNYGALRAMEREAGGVSVPRLLAPERVGFDTMCLLVWAGIRHEDKRITTEQVEQWLDEYMAAGGTFEALSILTTQALLASGILGKAPDDEKNATAGAAE